MRALVLVLLLVACGARTGVLSDDPAGGADAGVCVEEPWILFDYLDWPVADVYAVHADGSGLRRLGLPDPRVLHPTVTPDGRLLAYVVLADDGLSSVVVIMDLVAGTTERVRLGEGEGVTYPAFSLDASLIAFADGLDLHVARRDGSENRVLIRGPYELGAGLYGYGHPVFVDPTTILWTTAGLSGLIQVDGSGRTTLLTSSPRTILFPNMTLSPDRTELAALISCGDSFTTELRVYGRAALPADCTSGRIVVSGLTGRAAITHVPNPSWGPDDQIAFTQEDDVFVVGVEGGTPVQLTASLTAGERGATGNPVWAPGCTRLP